MLILMSKNKVLLYFRYSCGFMDAAYMESGEHWPSFGTVLVFQEIKRLQVIQMLYKSSVFLSKMQIHSFGYHLYCFCWAAILSNYCFQTSEHLCIGAWHDFVRMLFKPDKDIIIIIPSRGGHYLNNVVWFE